MPKNDAELEKEKLMERVAERPVTPIDGAIVHYQEFPSTSFGPALWTSGCLRTMTPDPPTDTR